MKKRNKDIFSSKALKESGRSKDSFSAEDLIFLNEQYENNKNRLRFTVIIRKFIDNGVIEFKETYIRYNNLEKFTGNKKDILYVYGEQIGNKVLQKTKDRFFKSRYGTTSLYEIMISESKIFKDISIDNYHRDQMIKSLNYINNISNNRCDWYPLLLIFVTNNIKNYIPRIKFIFKNRTSVTLKAHIIRYGKIDGIRRYNILRSNKSDYAKKNPNGCVLLNPIESSKIKYKHYGNIFSYKFWLRYNYDVLTTINIIKYILSIRNIDVSHNDDIIDKLKVITEDYDFVNEIIIKNLSKNICSKISLEFFKEISKEIDRGLIYGKNEIKIQNYKIDMYDSISDTAIEFYGDYWHRNPILYEKDFSSMGIPSKIIWEKDKKRIDTIKKYVNNVIIIWEKDYQDNPIETKDNLIKYIKEKRKEKNV